LFGLGLPVSDDSSCLGCPGARQSWLGLNGWFRQSPHLAIK
jgi:hypothetical protein